MKKYKNLLPVYIKGLCNQKYTLKQASESTGYSIRWLSKLKKDYLEKGDLIFENTKKGRIPSNKTPESLKTRIAILYASDTYKDVNWRYFRQCLEEFEGIQISLTTLRSILSEYGLVSPEARKKKKKDVTHRTRYRREHEGDLIQIDGTPFDWFYKSGDPKKYCIQGAIDDATGQITALYMTETECLYGYMEMLRITIEDYGKPREIYSDRAAIFCWNQKGNKELTIQEQLAGVHKKVTQWQRILDELQIRQVLAWTPQAKGRVERMWKTLQGRLPLEFYKAGIKTVTAANAFLRKYVEKFNAEFAKKPARENPFWLPCEENLDEILCAKFPRKSRSDGCLKFNSYTFAIEGCLNTRLKHCLICVSVRGIYAQMPDGLYYPLRPVDCDDDYFDPDPTVISKALQNIIDGYMLGYAKDVSF